MVIEGRIGLSGKDYRYNEATGEIELDSCQSGDERYILAWRHGEGGTSIGSTAVRR
jgi:hypothetical protein